MSLKYLFAILNFIFTLSAYGQLSELIKVNQVGYLKNNVKFGYVSADQPVAIGAWRVFDIDRNQVAYSGSGYVKVIDDVATEEFVYQLDFSSLNILGNYYLSVDGVGRSHDFLISSTSYNDAFRKIMKGFFYQRSGVELTSAHAAQWARPAEYDEDAFIYTGFDGTDVLFGDHVDTNGGWRDAGDPNKKVPPAAISVHQLMMLYEYFSTDIETANWNIPEDTDFEDLPDILKEIKVCIDWLLKMQRADGAVWHAVTQEDFYLVGMGHEDPNPRYLMPVSTTATASLASALAQAYRIFRDVDQSYADLCLDAAINAWKALGMGSIWNAPTINGANGNPQYPEQEGYSIDPPGINFTANYTDTVDTDEMYWAAIELFLSTQESEYYDAISTYSEPFVFYPSLVSEVATMASFSYVMGMKDTNDPISNNLKISIAGYADAYYAIADARGFNVSMSSGDYFWGSNNVVGQFAYTMILAYEITGNVNYKNHALHHLNYIMGSNSLNQSFISDVGDQDVKNIFHLPSFHDNVSQVVPGLIPGGPNFILVPTDQVHADLLTTQNPPPAKSYIDSEFSFASNETTILESAGWGFVTGYFYNNEIECTEGNQINTWVGPISGDWNASSANWSRNEIPTGCHHVIIPDGSSVSIGAGDTAVCLTLDVAPSGSLDVAQTARLEVVSE